MKTLLSNQDLTRISERHERDKRRATRHSKPLGRPESDRAGLLTHVKHLAARLDTAQQELAEQEREKLALVRELQKADKAGKQLSAQVLEAIDAGFLPAEGPPAAVAAADATYFVEPQLHAHGSQSYGPYGNAAPSACPQNCSSCQKGEKGAVGRG